MLFNILLLLLILLTTLYLATQGLISSLLALITAALSSILAMGLMESTQGIIAGWRPEYARGVTFLGLFLVIFAVTRIVADLVVPRDVKLPYLINRVCGGVVGFFAALVVLGTMVIGIEMLPLHTSLMGYDRFGDEQRMQGDAPGVAANNHNTWLAPERFVLLLWNGASGRGLGGSRAWADVHPDIDVESYGYRNTVLYASNHVVPGNLFEVQGAWVSGEAKELAPFGLKSPDSGKKFVMVRTAVKKGGGGPDSADPGSDPRFRVTPTEVRLVTKNEKQYYPVGYLEHGTEFTPLRLDTGHIVDDFQKSLAIDDWVFQIGDDETPALIEVKQLGRAALNDLKDKPFPALAASEYPAKTYRKETSTITVRVNTGGEAIEDGMVYVMRPVVKYKAISTTLQESYRHMVDVLDKMDAGDPNWKAAGAPGVPPQGAWKGPQSSLGVKIMNMPDDQMVDLDRALEIILFGPITADGRANAQIEADYVREKLVPLFTRVSEGSLIIKSASLKSGTAELKDIPKGGHLIFAFVRTGKSFYYWTKGQETKPNDAISVPFETRSAANPKIEVP